MENHREIKNTLTWHFEGNFNATIINGVIKELNLCEPGKGAGDCGRCLTSTDYKFLKSVHEALGDIFKFMNEENKRLGYSYPVEMEMSAQNPEEIISEMESYRSPQKIN
ncbi:MAG: hypothetical protein EOP42_26880 [Sphingobacteriaceae bacterium]|nr:MAG: hypothetical protein EOP42_26880 [Sphingobacteriaceae bacterium]